MADYINGYALALRELIIESKKITQYKEQAHTIVEAIEQNREYIEILDSKMIESKTKREIVEKGFKKVNVEYINFLKIIADRKKGKLVLPVLKKLIKLLNEELKINEGTVFSTKILSPAEMKTITKRVSEKINGEVSLINKIDNELISGIRVIVGDQLIEDSVHTRLEILRQELKGEGETYGD